MVELAVAVLTTASILAFTAARALQRTATETTQMSVNCPNN